MTGEKVGLGCVRSSSGAVLLSGTIRSPKSFFLQQLMLSSGNSGWFHPASLF
jgi:hypothetical protein